MASENLKRDQNFVTVLGGITDDSDQDIKMLRVDPITKRLLVKAVISGGVVTDVTATLPITSSGGSTPNISTSIATNKLIGRGTAGTGVMEEITIGTNISLSGTTLNVPTMSPSIGGAITGGTLGSVLFVNPASVIAQDNQNFYWDDTLNSLNISNTLGSELLTNGTFTGNATGWTVPSGYAYSSNTVVHSSNGTGALQPSTALTTVITGFEYQYSIDISSLTVGTATLACGGVTLVAITADGTYTGKFIATATTNLTLTPTNTARFTVDNISLKQLSGGVVSAGAHYGDTFNGVKSGLGATATSDAFIADNGTAATVSVPQVSPAFKWRARAWNASSSLSKTVDFRAWVLAGAANIFPNGMWKLQTSVDGASYSDLFSVDSATSGLGVNITTPGAQSNGVPGTTRAMTFSNSGTATYIDFLFSGARRGVIGADSSGGVNVYQSGGNGFALWQGSSGLSSPSLYSYSISTGLYHSGWGAFLNGVNAGGSGAPTSILQSAGSLGLQPTLITASETLTGAYTEILCDATNAASCTGTAAACSTYTGSGESTCNTHNEDGCSWNAGSSCSAFSGDPGTCAGTSGCSNDTTSCSGPTTDPACTDQNTAYGGSCSLDAGTNTCPSFTDTSSCNGASPCSAVVDGDCSALSDGGGDGTMCATKSECSYDSGTGACTGSYFTSCSGDNATPSCTGSYNNGTCSGTYGALCEGTALCSNINDSGTCAAASCTWSSGANLTMPANPPNGRTYTIKNVSSGGQDCVLLPNTDQTIELGSSKTLANLNDSTILAYYARTADCSVYNENQSLCEATSGCIYDSGGPTCSGTYTASKNWYELADNDTSAVTSVTAANGTITIGGGATTPTVGLNLGSANTWTAAITLRAGSTAAGTAPMYMQSGSFLTSPASGAWEWAGGSMPTFTNTNPTRLTLAGIENQQTWTATQIFKHTATTSVPVRIQAQTSQSANLTDWEAVGGTPMASMDVTGFISKYKSIATQGVGLVAIYKVGRATAQTAANTSVVTYTAPASDGSYEISANVLVTTSTLHNFTVTVDYTDEGNTARTQTLPFSVLAGTFITAITNASGTVPYTGIPIHIRCKASTAITVKTAGTFTTVTYNVEGIIRQLA